MGERPPPSRLDDAGERTLEIGGDRPIRISAGHRLTDCDGKCSRPHGHNYEVTVAVAGGLTEAGWVVDEGDATSVIAEWDHRFPVEAGDPPMPVESRPTARARPGDRR